MRQRLLPVWLMGLSNLTLGVGGAVALMTVPQLLAARGVPEPSITPVTAIALIPGFTGFLLAPILDWRFTRRAYATFFALLAAVALFAALLSLNNLPLLTGLLFTALMGVSLYISAVGGWLGSLVPAKDKAVLGAWMAIAQVSGFGVASMLAIFLLRHLPYALGAALLALLVMLPVLYFPFLPAPAADRKLASESFRDFFRDVLALLKNPIVLWTILFLVMPAASFALTNQLGGVGADYHASEWLVSMIGGVGVTVAGFAGALTVPRLGRSLSPLTLYVLIGGIGALFSLLLIVLPHTPMIFALALVGENVFQAAAFAVENTIILKTIGEDNPLAATQYALISAAPILPIAYMQAIDGAAYTGHGMAGSYLADGLLGLAACAGLTLLLQFVFRKGPMAVLRSKALNA